MNPLRLLAPLVTIIAVLAPSACSNDSTKKSPQKDASTADGSSGSGGTSGTGGSAGADAAAGTAGVAGSAGVSGSAGSDAGLDATADADASTGCATGTVRDLQSGACVACVDGGAAGAAGADAGGPYSAAVTCSQIATPTTSFDPATGLLVFHLDYALQVDSMDYSLSIYGSDADGGYIQATPTGTVPVVNNTATVDLSAMLGAGSALQSLNVQSLVFTDACGRTSTFDGNACDVDYLEMMQVDGGLWSGSCLPC